MPVERRRASRCRSGTHVAQGGLEQVDHEALFRGRVVLDRGVATGGGHDYLLLLQAAAELERKVPMEL